MANRYVVLTPVLAGLLAAPAAAGPSLASHEVRFRLDDRGRVVVPVHIGAEGPVEMVLDTGSNASAVSGEIARRLELPLVARSTVISAGGIALRGIVRLASVAVGAALADEVLATVTPAEDLEVAARGVHGILGQDFLAQFHYTLDYQRRVLSWDDLAEPPGTDARVDAAADAIALPLIPQDGRWVAELPQDESRDVLRVVPDSGADSLVFFERPSSRLPAMTPAGGAFLVAGLTGAREARMMRLPLLRVGSLVLRNQQVVTVDRPEPEAPDVDGLLPLHRFRRVTFRTREQLLLVSP